MRFLLPTTLPILLLAACGAEPVVDPERSYLTDEQRLELFDLERSDLLLGRALRPFNGAIRSGDTAAVRVALADGFEGVLAELPEAARLTPSGGPVASGALAPVEGGADALVRWVEGLDALFDEIETVAFARYSNSHEIIEGESARAESRGAFRVAGRTPTGLLEIAGTFLLEHQGFERFGEDEEVEDQVVDVEGWIHGLRLEEVVFAASEKHLFEDVTAVSGIVTDELHDNWVDGDRETLIFTGGCYLGDVNRDGHLDLLVTEILRPLLFMQEIPSTTRLWFGQGDGTFEDSGWRPPPPYVKFKNGVIRPFEPYAAIFDATGNGIVDVLHAGVKLPNADATLCDYDRDGLVDLFFVNSGPQAPKEERQENVFFDEDRTNGRANQLFRNLGGGRFENVTKKANASPAFGRTFAATWFYADGDDWPDLFGANEFGKNVFLVNQGDGTFREAADVDDVFGGFSMGVTSGDVDGDGRADLYVSNMYSKAGQRVYSHLDLGVYPKARPRSRATGSIAPQAIWPSPTTAPTPAATRSGGGSRARCSTSTSTAGSTSTPPAATSPSIRPSQTGEDASGRLWLRSLTTPRCGCPRHVSSTAPSTRCGSRTSPTSSPPGSSTSRCTSATGSS
jgi:hypothetical protein